MVNKYFNNYICVSLTTYYRLLVTDELLTNHLVIVIRQLTNYYLLNWPFISLTAYYHLLTTS